MNFTYDPVPLPARPLLSAADSLRRCTNFYAEISMRHTVREFSNRPVDRAVIETAVRSAGTAPSGANHQPWHFVCVSNPDTKRDIRLAAEAEERAFYAGKGGDTWLNDLGPLGTDAHKPFLETAPWLIAVFAERHGLDAAGKKIKNYYISESVGIATGLLITALHTAGLATLTHTPSPMKFLNKILHRPARERPFVLLVVGHAAKNAQIPRAATLKKPLGVISTFFD